MLETPNIFKMECKICIVCKENKPFDEYSFNGKYRRNQCKKCRVKFETIKRENNLEHYKNKDKIYYEKNKDNVLQRNKEYRDINKESINLQKKNYYQNNKEEIKQYHENNKDKRNEYKRNRTKNDIVLEFLRI